MEFFWAIVIGFALGIIIEIYKTLSDLRYKWVVKRKNREAERKMMQREKEREAERKQAQETHRLQLQESDTYSNAATLSVDDIIRNLDDYICGLDGHQFEYFCAELLKGNGFTNVKVTQGSGDQGVDILALKEGVRYAVQCKNYSSSLGNTPIQEVNAGKQLYNCHVGVVMTNSTFTQGAIKLAEATGTLLWDGRHVLQLAKNSPSAVANYFDYLL